MLNESTAAELTEDYLARLDAVQPRDLPDDLDLFDEAAASRGIRLNKAAYSLKHAEQRELMRARDWIGLWRAGMTIYVMVKLSGVTGVPLPEIGRQMRESG